MQIRWTALPFRARNDAEFHQNLTEWLSDVFYERLPARGYEIREEQIYTAFRMARALVDGTTLLAEAGPGTGKTFAYLLPAVCYARMKGAPVVISSASHVLQAQLADPEGDIQTLSRLLDLKIDARLAADPAEYVCELKVTHAMPARPPVGWDAFRDWAEKTGSGARREVPDLPDESWELLAWDPSLPCDTCPRRGHCHLMTARRGYRAAADLVICDHRLFSRDLLTRAERLDGGQVPLLPPYSAAILDEGHHVPDIWQRAQGYALSKRRLEGALERVGELVDREETLWVLGRAGQAARQFFAALAVAALPGEGKRHVTRNSGLLDVGVHLDTALEALQEALVTDEAMHEGLDLEAELQAYQGRLDELRAALRLLRAPEAIAWVEGADLWVVPRKPAGLFGTGRLSPGTPVIFSSATLEPEYQARVLDLPAHQSTQVGVPFDLAEQELIYQPAADGDSLSQLVEVLRATGGRALVLLNSIAEVRRYKALLAPLELPWPLIFEGDGARGAQLERFRSEVESVLFGTTFWEGVDVPGEALSCCIIPALPFPEHDPLIVERRAQAKADGDDPFVAVDLPEMLIRLKQGAGRLIRTAQDRGVLVLLDRSYLKEPWAEAVDAALPEDAERTADLAQVAAFLPARQRQRQS